MSFDKYIIYQKGIEVGEIPLFERLTYENLDGVCKIEITRCVLLKELLTSDTYDIHYYISGLTTDSIIAYTGCKFSCDRIELRPDGLLHLLNVKTETKIVYTNKEFVS